jgi:uncharacterized membrane protein YczE
MKLAWIALMILGILSIIMNIPIYIVGVKIPNTTNIVSKMAYYTGSNLFFLFGIILLSISYSIRIKWKKRKLKIEQDEIVDSISK